MSQIYKYTCVKCNYGTDHSTSFKKHLLTDLHVKGKRKARSDKVIMEPLKCAKCNYESINQVNYQSHVLHNHATAEEREKGFPYYCKTCDCGTFSTTSYERHMATKAHKMKSIV
jgi:hypothetical protein